MVQIAAVFLDRDGVIIRNRDDYVRRWSDVEFLPGAVAAVAALTRSRPVVVITNQSAVGRGLMTRGTLDDIHERIGEAVVRAGGRRPIFVVCPHRPDEACECRKPRPGMIVAAAASLGIPVSSVVFVGDQLIDLQAAAAAGCPAILVTTGSTPTDQQLVAAPPHRVASDLGAAAMLIAAGDAT